MPSLTPTGAAPCCNRVWPALRLAPASGRCGKRLVDSFPPWRAGAQTAAALMRASAQPPALPWRSPMRLALPHSSRRGFVDRFSAGMGHMRRSAGGFAAAGVSARGFHVASLRDAGRAAVRMSSASSASCGPGS